MVKTVITTTKEAIHLVRSLQRLRLKLKAKPQRVETVFGSLKDADFTTGNVPLDDVHSLRLLKSWICEYFRGDRHIEFHTRLYLADINKHLCSVGGPVDQIFTRYGMGYDKKGEKWKPILPFIYPLKQAGTKSVTIRRKWKGEQWEASGSWYIADRDGKRLFTPETNGEGFLRKDYFMLIIAPNTFTNEAFSTGQKHIMVAPAHGLAQLAVKKILDSDEILGELIKVRQRNEYLQAIIEVPAEPKKHGYEPTGEFPICVVEPLDPDEFKKLGTFRSWYSG